MTAFIEARGLSKSFEAPDGVRQVLDDISLFVAQGEFVSILGPMGCGKSTLLGIIAGLIAPDTGSVTVAGEDVREIRKDAAFVFQNYSLLPWFTALENVRLAVRAAFPAEPRARHLERSREALEMVGLGPAASRRPGQLSGGMRQRVAIARAFATEPRLLFLDEPFSALDALTRATLQQELLRLCSMTGRSLTTVMITNSVDEAVLLSDRILPMSRGPRAHLGTAAHVALPRPRQPAALETSDAAVHVRGQVIDALSRQFVAPAPLRGHR